MSGTLPNLFIIGAMKCGTSSLHYYLDQHPSISMSTEKEPNIFSRPDWRDLLSRYDDLLDASAPVRGESSTNYTKHPKFPGVPERIAEMAPDAKLVYVVGDPIRRSIAQYLQNVSDEFERRPFEEALDDFDDPRNTYVWNSRYATQVELYLERFPASSLLVLDQADLRADRTAVLREVFAFLGVDETFESPRFDAMLNTRKERRRMSRIGLRVRESRAMDVYRRLPARVRRPVTRSARQVLSRPLERPVMSDELRRRLIAVYEPELERLERLTGRRVAWTPEPAPQA